VILHWLGDMFDPALAGYWGTRDVAAASDLVLGLIERNAGKVDGIKISLLDQAHERRSAPACRRACGSIPATISTMRP
jgi:hypothetical protein